MTAPASTARIVPILSAQAVGLICGLIGIKVNSHWLPPEVMGVYGIFLTLTPFGLLVVHAGTMRYLERHWARAEDRRSLGRGVLNIWLRRLPWVLAGALAGGSAVEGMAPGQFGAAAAGLFAAMALLPLVGFVQAALQARQSHWTDLGVVTVAAVSRTFFGPLAFIMTGGVLTAIWAGFAIHALLAAAVGGWIMAGLMRRLPPASSTSPPMALPKVYTGPLFVGLAVSGWVLAGMNRWVVAGFHGEVQAGYFSLIGGAAMILPAMLGNALIQFVRPGLFRLGDEGHMTELKRRTDGWAGVYTVTGVAGAWVLAKIGPWLVGPLIAPAYADGLVWLGPAGSFGVALGLLPLFSTTLVAGQKESANGPAVLGASIALGVIVVSAGSQDLSHLRWALWLSPILPWLITRPLTMRALRNT